MGKSTINVPCSIAMLVYQRVVFFSELWMRKICPCPEKKVFGVYWSLEISINSSKNMTKHQSDVATFGNVSGRSSESKIETLISSRCFSRPRTWLKTTWPQCHDTSTAEKLFPENVGKMGIEKERIVHFLWGTCLKRYSWLWIGLAVWTCFPFSDIIYTYYIYNYNYYNCIILYLYVGL